MKKAINNIILTVIFAGLLSGCGSGASDVVQDTSEADSQEISVDAGGILDPSAVLNLSIKDNSLDAYSAAGRAALQPEKLENEGGGMERSVLGVTGAYHFKKHVLSTAAESWDEVLFVTGEGKAGSERYEVKDQLWGIGPVVGTDHYVVFNEKLQEDGEPRYLLTVRDENHEYLRELPLDFLSGELDEVLAGLSDFLVDETGRVHMLWNKYMLLSQEGEILGEYSPEDGYIKKLVPLYDGRIAFEVEAEGVEGGIILQYIDEETHNPVTLATLKKEAFCLTLFDEDTLLYADREGVYRSGLSGENPEMIYRWSNHGVIAHRVSALEADEEGRIKLIYSDSEYDNYLCLEPTTEEVAVCEITMGVGPDDMNFYKWVVAEFNKRYPTCHIELIEHTYENEAVLLTQLTAGKGPVLLDPSMLGFEELEELCEGVEASREDLQYIHYFCGETGMSEDADEIYTRLRGKLYRLVSILVRAFAEAKPYMVDICTAFEWKNYEEKVRFYIELKQIIGNKSGDFLDLKAYEPDMRKLIDNYIIASDSIKVGEFDDLTLLDFVNDQGNTMTAGHSTSGQRQSAAEAIENNIRRKMVERVTVNPKYYEKMSAILEELIEERKQGVASYKELLEKYINLAKDVDYPEENEAYPESIRKSRALQALYDNVGEDEELAIRLHDAVMRSKMNGFRGDTIKENRIKRAMLVILKEDSEMERLFKIIKKQEEY